MTGQASIGAEPLYSTLGSDPDLGEMVDLFVEEMPQRAAKFLALLNRQDWEELRCAAHQLKGAAGSYGFSQISPHAARLEDAVDNRLPEDRIRQCVEQLIDSCNRARSGPPY